MQDITPPNNSPISNTPPFDLINTAAFNTDMAYQHLQRRFGPRVHRNEPLAQHSAFGVGGTADIWITVETRDELIGLVSLCAEEHWPLLLIGNGSNIIFTDAGVRGIVARMTGYDYQINKEPDGKTILSVSAGSSWPRLAYELALLGWGGVEFGIGIPGTLGAGIVSNAGAHNQELGEVLESIDVLDARGCNIEGDSLSLPIRRRYTKDELDLAYRYSRFRAGHESVFDEQNNILPVPHLLIEPAEIVMTLSIRLHQETPQKLMEKLRQYQQERKELEPLHNHTGPIFKDPPGQQASKLIEQAGMKGFSMGTVQVSDRNANYIVNKGGATTSDILSLIKEMRRRVQDKCNVKLELNVELRGE
ncbi:UDP-N-acetylmuramate dehydrogenase [Dictyobacter formicarum]|uniref:UDP-N-acetylenolpyruvoylglucosamine reductase n=1 Tax=Dictyobacter formicarum TaxID=2778368 RepID=A0ABQ3VCA0_9CHLR|nr:UDP-N-acetylmuramate dehydrogenase [Dictyobacter formicarum]GHO83590.1 UDP-N-acetylenolpyruvoylglucosamine reductase [Dictyobacter formicarum]